MAKYCSSAVMLYFSQTVKCSNSHIT